MSVLPDFLNPGPTAPWLSPEGLVVGEVTVTTDHGEQTQVLLRLLVDGDIGAMDVVITPEMATRLIAALGERVTEIEAADG